MYTSRQVQSRIYSSDSLQAGRLLASILLLVSRFKGIRTSSEASRDTLDNPTKHSKGHILWVFLPPFKIPHQSKQFIQPLGGVRVNRIFDACVRRIVLDQDWVTAANDNKLDTLGR